MRWSSLACGLLLAASCPGQPLPGTGALPPGGDLAIEMVEGIKRWLAAEAPRRVARRPPTVERLREIIGAVDARVPFDDLELVATLRQPAVTQRASGFTVRSVRWPVFEGVHGEGLLFDPAGAPVGHLVLLNDPVQGPEDSYRAEKLVHEGWQVLAPTLIDRADTWSGNPGLRMTNQPHREFLYRMAFPLGRHIIGYEVQKALAAVDWFARADDGRPIGLNGTGEGGLIAFYAGAIDPRVSITEVTGYFGNRGGIAEQPIYRNVWTLLRDFGDAEVATLYGGRKLVVGPGGPQIDGPPPERSGRRGAAPGRLVPVAVAEVRAEVERARRLGAAVEMREESDPTHAPLPAADAEGRMRRQFDELVAYTQRLARGSQAVRERWWAPADHSSPERWQAAAKPYRERILDDMIGCLPEPSLPVNPRSRLSYTGEKWNGYEVRLDLEPGVFAYGVLLVPKQRRPGERLPVVVAQHGLMGRPQDLFNQPGDGRPFGFYQNIGSKLADLGFVVYLPQNPYIGDFRPIVRLGYPWGLSLYAFIQAQNRRALDWLTGLDFVDPRRIGYYGLSYGGKTALRIPPFDDRFTLSICSGDFNEWVYKLTTVDAGYSYVFSGEYDMPEWNLAHVASHAELAWLMAPRPFMVERGHRDGVGTDEWVAYEYARVRRFYDQMGIGERTAIEFFNGPHQIHGVGTVEFLRRWLGGGAR